MPTFCTNCGAPIAGAFCGACGQRAPAQNPPAGQSSSAPPQAAAPRHPVAVPPGSSSKLLLIGGGIVLLMVVLGFAATLYGVQWFKRKVYALSGGTFGSSGQVSRGNACALLSPAELQQVLGVTVERSAEITESKPGCAYFTNPTAFADLQKIAVEQARRDSERASKDPAINNSKSDNPLELLRHTEEMEGIVKSFGLTAPDKEGRVFAFTVDSSFGSRHWTMLRATLSAVPGFKEIDGVGDHAMMGSFGHAFYVLKGDNLITMETMFVPEVRVRGAELGRKVVSHL